jgi:N-methylhydantoinase A/oxoprolinase/acetone carboxylase beta subunit
MRGVAVLGVDVGGTFTDAVLLADGRLHTVKVPTRPSQEESVVEAALAVRADGALGMAAGRRGCRSRS